MEGGFYGSICLCMLLVMVAMLVFYSIFSCVVREDVEKLTYIPAAHESLFGNESPSAPFLILLQPLLRPVQPPLVNGTKKNFAYLASVSERAKDGAMTVVTIKKDRRTARKKKIWKTSRRHLLVGDF